MKELITQLQDGKLTPNTPNDADILKSEFKNYQLVRIKAYNVGIKKERSITQLGLLHACFKLVADNTEDKRFNHPAKVKLACKVACHYVVPDIVVVKVDGTVIFQYRSFAFSELDHMEACNIFERCFEYMAKILKITKEKLIEEAQGRMKKMGYVKQGC